MVLGEISVSHMATSLWKELNYSDSANFCKF
jgi:hypothetical protein